MNYLPPSICGSGSLFLSGSIFFGSYVQVANMKHEETVFIKKFVSSLLQAA